jgi:hypothetical protein
MVDVPLRAPQEMGVEFHYSGRLYFRRMSRETSAAGR